MADKGLLESPYFTPCVFTPAPPYMALVMAIDTHIEPGTLYERTRQLLRQDPRGTLNVHKVSGLPFYWLRKVYAGEINDPGVNRIQKLYEFLTQEKLALK